MPSNSRLAIAIHTAGLLALCGSNPLTSGKIARSVKTNPVVVRRIIGNLVRCGLVEVRMGPGGGAFLTRPPEEITLADIYFAVNDDELFHVPELEGTHQCVIGRTVRPVLQKIFRNAENALLSNLASVTLADVMSKVKECIEPSELKKD